MRARPPKAGEPHGSVSADSQLLADETLAYVPQPGPKLCSFLGDKESKESNWVSQPAVCLPCARARTLRHETTPSLPQSITTRMSC